jgi:hypothetical protein
MGDYKIKLNCVLDFNSKGERDLISQLEKKRARHKLGEFVSVCIKACYENPDVLVKAGYSSSEAVGLTEARNNFLRTVDNHMKELNRKVDDIFKMAYTLYTAYKFGKSIGTEGKTTAVMQAGFILEKQLKEICSTLGLPSSMYLYESNKFEDKDRYADEVLEYLIEKYSNIVSEIEAGISARKTSTNEASNEAKQLDVRENEVLTGKSDRESEGLNASERKEVEISFIDSAGAEDEVVDFGGNDFKLLMEFVGENA